MYKKDDIIKCTITAFKEYGIFVKVDDEYDGLIHISEISDNFVKAVSDYGDIGEIIYAKVLDNDVNNHHLKLSIKNINYKVDGKNIEELEKDGFLPLKKHLNIWINEKINEINKDKYK